jgi:hypothetical protein
MTIENFTDKDVPDQSGRVFFVTGANSGLGYQTAKLLAGRGARVLLGCRSLERAEAAIGGSFLWIWETLNPFAARRSWWRKSQDWMFWSIMPGS